MDWIHAIQERVGGSSIVVNFVQAQSLCLNDVERIERGD